jgi:hypothetical protein
MLKNFCTVAPGRPGTHISYPLPEDLLVPLFMKKTLLLLVLACCSLLPAQVVTSFLRIPELRVRAVLYDSQGDLYVCGYRPSTGPESWQPTVVNQTTYLVRKYAVSSGQMLWEQQFFTPFILYLQGEHMVNDHVLLGGHFQDSLVTGAGVFHAKGLQDLFFISIDSQGKVTARTDGGTGDENMCGFAPDQQGAIYVSGRFSGTCEFGGGPVQASIPQAFLAKIDGVTGTPVWMELATAAPGQSLASFHGLKLRDGYLTSWSFGRSVMNNSKVEFGSIDFPDRSDKWDLNGHHLGLLSEHFTYSHTQMYLGTGSDGLDRTIYYQHYKGPQFISFKSLDKKLEIVSQKIIPYADRLRGGMYSNQGNFVAAFDGVADDSTSRGTFIVRGNIENGEILDWIPVVNNYYHWYLNLKTAPYRNTEIIAFGRMDSVLTIANQSFYSSSQKQVGWDYVAVVQPALKTGISQLQQSPSALRLSPNPACDKVYVSCDALTSEAEVVITDIFGKAVFWQNYPGGGPAEIRVDAFRPGVYVVQVNSRNMMSSQKLIVE